MKLNQPLMFRALATRRAEVCVEGKDPELQALRAHMPEPTQIGYQFFQMPIHPAPRFLWDAEAALQAASAIRVETFERVLVRDQESGAVFWAWRNLRDGKSYI